MSLGNPGDVAAEDVFVKLVDIPRHAEIWSSVAFKIEARTDDTALLRYDVIPPRYTSFTAVLPFEKRGQELMRYARERYYAAGRITRSETDTDWIACQVFEKLARTDGFVAGVKGDHRRYSDLITDDDIRFGKNLLTVEDR